MKTTMLPTILFALVAILPVHAEDQPVKNNAKTVGFQEALKRLEEGNARYVAAKPKHPHESLDWRHTLEDGQHPFAVVIGCSDSRVIPELIFDQGLGDLFVIRVAGNIVDTDVAASVEYAVDHLGTQLVVVLGHSQCGAVTATIDHFLDAEGEPAEVVSLLNMIEPAIMGVPKDLPREKRIELTINRNVELAVRRLSRIPDLHRSVAAGKVKILGAVYDMHTGKVEIPNHSESLTRK